LRFVFIAAHPGYGQFSASGLVANALSDALSLLFEISRPIASGLAVPRLIGGGLFACPGTAATR
jgi:hypothetical protein